MLDRKKGSIGSRLWYLEVFVLSLTLCFIFAILSQLMLMHANLALALFLILILIVVSVVFDMIGVAVAASNIKPFLEMNRHRRRGVVQAIWLVKNADRVSSVCADVVGDICSILSGAGGVAISIILVSKAPGLGNAILSTLVSSLIAALTVLGKALGKSYALNYSTAVILQTGKFLSLFTRNKNNK